MMKRGWIKKAAMAAAVLAAAAYLFCLPANLFKDTCYSTVVLDKDGQLLGARIADDGQWRFPPVCDSVPHKFASALIQFEDRYFYIHRGVDPYSLARALWGNIRSGEITSGGSTLSMQVIRLSRKGKKRTMKEKLVEAVLATRLELTYSKKEILSMYAAHAPFGGNVVGLEAASWRYFGRPSSELSWAESATLAVLPNSPSNIHPGKNREALLQKRNKLLDRLLQCKEITPEEHELAIEEPLVLKPRHIPSYTPHLTDRYHRSRRGQTVRTSIDFAIQQHLVSRMELWGRDLAAMGIADLAAVIIDVRTGDIIAYEGNARVNIKRAGAMVDIAMSPRSTGSILKPLLYCAMLQEGDMLPRTLLSDTPINVNGFSPRNFDLKFYGAVPADEALARSLNIPAVNMLRRYGTSRFHELLRHCGMTTLTRDADDYGLSLILGGAEGRLAEITEIYATLSRIYQYGSDDDSFPLTDRVAIWHTLDALKDLGRPDEIELRMVRSIRKVAWKTGTSWGFRDAWAVGVTPDYAIGVWAGNADGSGVPGLVGARTAGPVMFDILNLLPSGKADNGYASKGWFLPPLAAEGIEGEVCPQSGHLKGPYCPQADTLLLPPAAMNSDVCPYHKTEDGAFVLPPSMEWYYKKDHPEYQGLRTTHNGQVMEFIYPSEGARLHIPIQLSGEKGSIVFNLAHRDAATMVWWHLDGSYIGQTTDIHQMALSPPPGRHRLTVVDASGNSKSIAFEINKL